MNFFGNAKAADPKKESKDPVVQAKNWKRQLQRVCIGGLVQLTIDSMDMYTYHFFVLYRKLINWIVTKSNYKKRKIKLPKNAKN